MPRRRIVHQAPPVGRWSPETLARAVFGSSATFGYRWRYVADLPADAAARRCWQCGSRTARHQFTSQHGHVAEFCDGCIRPDAFRDDASAEVRHLVVIPDAVPLRAYEYDIGLGMLREHIRFSAVRDTNELAERGYGDCDNCGARVHKDWIRTGPDGTAELCPPCFDEAEECTRQLIRGYHHGTPNPTPIRSKWSERRKDLFFGVELEVEVKNASDDGDDTYCDECESRTCSCYDRPSYSNKNEAAQDVLNALLSNPGPLEGPVKRKRDVIRFEEDGSLDHGFEIISLPLSLPDHRHLWNTVLNDRSVRRQLISHQTETCGLHVHVSRSALTAGQIARMVYFVHNRQNEALIRAIARRYNVSYARIEQKDSIAAAERCHDGKYYAVNTENSQTIEFRLFRGSCNPDAVVSAVEFVNALVKFTEDGRPWQNEVTALQFLNFLNHQTLRRETMTLRKYLMSRGVHWAKSSWGRVLPGVEIGET